MIQNDTNLIIVIEYNNNGNQKKIRRIFKYYTNPQKNSLTNPLKECDTTSTCLTVLLILYSSKEQRIRARTNMVNRKKDYKTFRFLRVTEWTFNFFLQHLSIQCHANRS